MTEPTTPEPTVEERPGYRKCFKTGGGFAVWVPIDPEVAAAPEPVNPATISNEDGCAGCGRDRERA